MTKTWEFPSHFPTYWHYSAFYNHMIMTQMSVCCHVHVGIQSLLFDVSIKLCFRMGSILFLLPLSLTITYLTIDFFDTSQQNILIDESKKVSVVGFFFPLVSVCLRPGDVMVMAGVMTLSWKSCVMRIIRYNNCDKCDAKNASVDSRESDWRQFAAVMTS